MKKIIHIFLKLKKNKHGQYEDCLCQTMNIIGKAMSRKAI